MAGGSPGPCHGRGAAAIYPVRLKSAVVRAAARSFRAASRVWASGILRSSPARRNSRRICGWVQTTTGCVVRGGTLGRADQRAEPGRVDEADLVQVIHQRPAGGRQVEKARAQPGHAGNVNLPDGGHDFTAPFAPDPDGSASPWPASHSVSLSS